MSHIIVAGERFEIRAAALTVYHASAEEADWNLELACGEQTLWLAGTVTPGPDSAAALVGAEVAVDLRSLDEVVRGLLGRAVTLFPGGQAVCALRFGLVASPAGVGLVVTSRCDWDRYHDTFPGLGEIEVTLAIDARVAALHPGQQPP